MNILISTGLVPLSYILLFRLASIVAVVCLISACQYWRTEYLLGWLFGVIIMLTCGFGLATGPIDIVVYMLIPTIISMFRF